MMRARHLLAAALAAFLATFTLAPDSAQAQKSADTLRVGFSFPFDTIDAYYTGLREVKLVIGEMAFDTLVGRDPKTFKDVPLLATSWRWIDDLTLEMDLRQGVKWHDGVEFTGADVAYTFAYLNDPQNKLPNREWFDWVKDVEQINPHKIRLKLSRPAGAALAFLSQVTPILPKDFYGPGGSVKRLVGTGPYRITSFEPQKQAILERNPNYFKDGIKGTPAINKVIIRNLPDEATVMAEFLSGGIDWMWRLPPEQADRFKALPGKTVASGGTMRVFWLGFDVMGRDPNTPYKDVRVRRAIAHAIDRSKMAKELVGPGADVVHVLCYPLQTGCPDQSTVTHYDYSPAKAKALLAEAGFPNGFSSSVWTYAQGLNRVFLESIQGYLNAVGIKLSVEITPSFTAFADLVAQGKTPMVMESHGQYNINDVEIVMPFAFYGGSRDNVKDPQVIDWIKQALATSLPKRVDLYHNAAKRISNEVLYLPLFTTSIMYAHTSDLDFTPWNDEDPRFFMSKWK
ncbi:MAG: ABC transporter substrate-binding protein [Rhodospirillales bacterium]|nr:ABC transporter substrate-binding protein [Rhodospirillales bacterium]